MKDIVTQKRVISKGTKALHMRCEIKGIYVHSVQDIHNTAINQHILTMMVQNYSMALLDSSLQQTCFEVRFEPVEMLTATVSGQSTFVPVHDQAMAQWKQGRA